MPTRRRKCRGATAVMCRARPPGVVRSPCSTRGGTGLRLRPGAPAGPCRSRRTGRRAPRIDPARGSAAGDVVEVGDLAVDVLVIGLPEGHAPERIAFPLRRRGQGVRQRVVVAVQGRHLRSERSPRRASQRGHVENEIRIFLVGQGQCVGEDQPALRVGVAHLDGQALAGVDHVSGPERPSVDAVLHRRHQHPKAHGQVRVHDHVGESQNARGAAHVLLHECHALRGLEVQPARVEADALAHERELWPIRFAPAKLQQARFLGSGTPDRVDGRQAVLEQRVADELAEPGPVARRELCSCRTEF